MLRSLHIENLAVIRKVDIDFSEGFIALTGETGAGKSIIINSINLLLGAKADKELIRTGEASATVSGVFGPVNERVMNSLTECGLSPDEDLNILIQRTVTADGKSTVKINGRTITLALLRMITSNLVSIHGQSDTADLTDVKKQLDLLDIHAENEILLSNYKEAYFELESIRREIEDISKKEHERERLMEILKYQIEDIEQHRLHDGEEEELIERKLKIKNSEKLTKNAGFAFKALRGSEKGSVSLLLDKSASALSQISDVIPKFEEYAETLRDMIYQVDDIAEEIYSEISNMEDDPEETLNDIESRLDKISKLKRKYGLTVRDILEFKDKAKSELETLDNAEFLIEELTKKEEIAYSRALDIANLLHENRVNSARTVETQVKSVLEFLDMPKVVFFASINVEYKNGKKLLHEHGFDNVEFFISANRGVDAQPLAKVASGGELARVMLAIKSVIANKDGTESVVFDEIDAGVSGKTARKIGVKMLEMSKKIQLFCVTHSAQIASLSDIHLLISKSDINGKTETSLKILDEAGRINELSRILGGIAVTDAQKRAAVDMLEERQSYIK